MKILVTGAGGFIGRHLCRYLSNDHEVVGILRNSDDGLLPCRILGCDLTKTEDVDRLIQQCGKDVDVIIHAAARLGVGNSVLDLDVFYDNMKITEAVMCLVHRLTPKHLIHLSTIGVYPNITGSYDEESLTQPSKNAECYYSLAKLTAENCLDFSLKDTRTTVTHFRCAQVYGEGMREDRIIPLMKRELAEGNKINVWGDGKRESNFISVERLLFITKCFIEHPVPGIFNIGDEQLSYYQLAERLIRECGKEDSRIVLKKEGVRSEVKIDCFKLEQFMESIALKERKTNESTVVTARR